MGRIVGDCHRDRALFHVSGDGYAASPIDAPREAVGDIAKAVGVRALLVGFRRAPEHKYPAQIEDVEKAYRWLLEQGIRPQNIASIGHSIGGSLAVNLPLPFVRRGLLCQAPSVGLALVQLEVNNRQWIATLRPTNCSSQSVLTTRSVN